MGQRHQVGEARLIWQTACLDWEDRILSGRSLVPDLPLFADRAKQGLDAFKLLRLPDVIGTPRIGDVGGEWLFGIVEALFGSYNAKLKKREIQEYFLLIPKKNSKSSSAAAMMVAAIIVNERPDAEFNLLAPTIEVAGIAFRQARGIVKIDPVLAKWFHIQDNIRRITFRNTGAFLQIKAADTDIVTGSKPLGTLIDETHVFSTKAHAADIFLEMRGALASRPDGFLIQITTQSKSPPAGVFKSELARARDVRDGKLKLPKPLLPILYELPASVVDRWQEEKFWPVVNPNLGRSVDIDFLRSSLIDAKRKGPQEIALLASQHWNIELGISLRGDGWPGAQFWEKQTDGSLDLERVLDRSEIIVCGVDGGGLDDLFGVAVLGRCRETKNWLCWTHAWCHEGVLERRQTIASTLRDFQARGELTIVTDELDDISAITAIIADIKGRGILGQVAVDPAGIGQLIDALGVPEIGITPENKSIIGAPQGYQMMSALKTAERKLANGTLWHHDSHLAKWCVSNVKVEPTATAIRPTKINAGDAKIDVAMAMFNAVTVMSMNPARAPEYQMIFA